MIQDIRIQTVFISELKIKLCSHIHSQHVIDKSYLTYRIRVSRIMQIPEEGKIILPQSIRQPDTFLGGKNTVPPVIDLIGIKQGFPYIFLKVDIIIFLLHRAAAESALRKAALRIRLSHLPCHRTDKHILSGSFSPGVLLLPFHNIADQPE